MHNRRSSNPARFGFPFSRQRTYNPANMLLRVVHNLLLAFYFAAPRRRDRDRCVDCAKQKRNAPGGWLVGIILAGVIIGAAVTVLYGVAVGGRVRVGQAMLASYFAIGMILLLRIFDWIIQKAIAAILRVNRAVEKPSVSVSPAP